MIEKLPFGRTGHMSTRTLFGAAALGSVTQAVADEVLELLPSLHSPTVNHLSDKVWCSIETVMEEKQVREIIPALKSAGAEGIIELALNKVIS